jgi:hypothetical protein
VLLCAVEKAKKLGKREKKKLFLENNKQQKTTF